MFKDEADFERIVSRLRIDDKPNLAHREGLRRQMLGVFNETAKQPPVEKIVFRTQETTILKSPFLKLAVAAAVLIVVAIGAYQLIKPDNAGVAPKGPIEPRPYSSDPVYTGTPELVPIQLELPRPMFVGTPQNTQVANLERPTGRPRPPFLAPAGTKNVAEGEPVSSSDEEPIIGEIEMITDGDKEAADGSYVELGPFLQSVTIDLEARHQIYAIIVWHYHKQARVYYDVVVQVADDRDFITNVKTLFNNDIDNSAGLGVGKDKHYTETNEGKLIDAKGVKARYVRLYSKGNTSDDLNHYIEVAVYGKPVTDAPEPVADASKPASDTRRLVPLETKLPRPMYLYHRSANFWKSIPNLEQWPPQLRQPLLVPRGTKNAALGKPVASTDKEPLIGDLKMITDGDTEATDGSYVELNPGLQSITIDLEAEHEIYAVVVWHRHRAPCAYFDIVVQIAAGMETPRYLNTLFNNDHDNSAGFGFGKGKNYIETYQGKLIDSKGARGRYVRLYSNGNDMNNWNHYIEVEVYGKEAG